MLRMLKLSLIGLGVVATIVGFFLPWAHIDMREPDAVRQLRQANPFGDTVGGLTKDLGRIAVKVRRGAETVTGTLPSMADIPKQVSGVQIPQMANQENAKVAMALMELLTQQRQNLGAKSYAVYLLPGIALLCGILLILVGRQPVLSVGIGVLCAAIAAGGFWKLLTTNTSTLFIAITIGVGLWLSLWGYVLLALAGFCGALKPTSRA